MTLGSLHDNLPLSQIYFLHIPKTAGSAVSTILLPTLLCGDIRLTADLRANANATHDVFGIECALGQHVKIAEAENRLNADFSDFKVLVFVRNPYARAFSSYKYRLKMEERSGGPPSGMPAVSGTSFETFICDPQFRYAYANLMSPQAKWVPDKNAVFLGKVESLERDIANFVYMMGLDTKKINLKTRVNVSSRQDEWRDMSTAAKQEIQRLYECDFEAFEYPIR